MTYSIVLRDPVKNHFGIAVATKHFAVGALVPHLAAGIGAIATQSTTNPHLGLQGLAAMAKGQLVQDALEQALEQDTSPQKKDRCTELIVMGILGLGQEQRPSPGQDM